MSWYDERDGKDNDSKDNEKESPKVPKKTEVACHFCRGRKLKCDGGRPLCSQCARRVQDCVYDNSVRRRGPGRKNRGGVRPARRQRGQVQGSEPSTSMSTLIDPSSSAFRDLPSPSYQTPNPLPGPPIPQYNFDLGQLPPTTPRIETGPFSSSEGSSRTRGQHRLHADPLYSQPPYTRSSQHSDYDQQHRSQQYHLSLATPQPTLRHPEQAHMYGEEYSQASTSGHSSQAGNVIYRGERLTESHALGYPAEQGDDEGPARSQLKRRRASSPPEDNAPSSSKRRRYDYDRDKDDHIR